MGFKLLEFLFHFSVLVLFVLNIGLVGVDLLFILFIPFSDFVKVEDQPSVLHHFLPIIQLPPFNHLLATFVNLVNRLFEVVDLPIHFVDSFGIGILLLSLLIKDICVVELPHIVRPFFWVPLDTVIDIH